CEMPGFDSTTKPVCRGDGGFGFETEAWEVALRAGSRRERSLDGGELRGEKAHLFKALEGCILVGDFDFAGGFAPLRVHGGVRVGGHSFSLLFCGLYGIYRARRQKMQVAGIIVLNLCA